MKHPLSGVSREGVETFLATTGALHRFEERRDTAAWLAPVGDAHDRSRRQRAAPVIRAQEDVLPWQFEAFLEASDGEVLRCVYVGEPVRQHLGAAKPHGTGEVGVLRLPITGIGVFDEHGRLVLVGISLDCGSADDDDGQLVALVTSAS